MLKIKELRIALGLQQKEVASALMLPQNTFSQYETGKRTPDIDTLNAMADYFKCSLDYLAGRNENENVEQHEEAKKLLRELQTEVEIHKLVSELREKNENSEFAPEILQKIKDILQKY